ncbi:MAG: hypothetical protein J5597_00375 [Spirochaetaceae bacterium]|nr:hypothetical protein [Spirochaetaceae bacterium]
MNEAQREEKIKNSATAQFYEKFEKDYKTKNPVQSLLLTECGCSLVYTSKLYAVTGNPSCVKQVS